MSADVRINAVISEGHVYVTQALPVETLRMMLREADEKKADSVSLRLGISIEDWTLTAAKTTVEIIEINQKRREEAQKRRLIMPASPFDVRGIKPLRPK